MEVAHKLSLHPVHLTDSNRTLNPSVLIPFCIYQTDMLALGNQVSEFPHPVCSMFEPSVLEGQLCYSINISKVTNRTTKTGLGGNLFLILDPGRPFNRLIEDEDLEDDQEKMLSIDVNALKRGKNLAKVHLSTLVSYSGYRSAIFVLTALKKMTGTDDFMKLPEDVKDCRIEDFEDCKVRRYSTAVKKKCGCVPWALSKVLWIEVNLK